MSSLIENVIGRGSLAGQLWHLRIMYSIPQYYPNHSSSRINTHPSPLLHNFKYVLQFRHVEKEVMSLLFIVLRRMGRADGDGGEYSIVYAVGCTVAVRMTIH